MIDSDITPELLQTIDIRVKAFFSNPTENPISQADLAQYYENRQEVNWDEDEDWDEWDED